MAPAFEPASLTNESRTHAAEPKREPDTGVAQTSQLALHAASIVPRDPDGVGSAAARSLAIPSLRGPVLQRVQRSFGNRFSQRLVDKSPARLSSVGQAPTDLKVVPPSGGGQGLDTNTQQNLETHFGADFSKVRVHTDHEAGNSAQSIQAAAYTSGRDIYFAPGQYSPATDSGRRLLAHETAHVVQQASGLAPGRIAARDSGGVKVGAPDDPLEAEAELAAEKFVSGNASTLPPKSGTPPVMQRSVKGEVIQRDKSVEKRWIDSRTFYERHRSMIWSDFLELFSKLPFASGSPYASWSYGNNHDFIYDTFEPLLLHGDWNLLVATAAPADVEAALRRGREASSYGLGTSGEAPDEYNKGVALELRNVFRPLVQGSLNRISPQFVAAEYLAMNLELEHGHAFTNAMLQPRPDIHLLVPSHPLDKCTIAGLMGGYGPTGRLQVDYEQYESSGAAATIYSQLKTVRSVHFTWAADPATWLWIRVTGPPDATAEEVANELYGDPSGANTIIAAAPLFAFKPSLLTPKHFAEWKDVAGMSPMVAQDELPPLMDPALQMQQSESSDEAALAQARGQQPTGSTKEQVIARLQNCLRSIGEIATASQNMGTGLVQGYSAETNIRKRIEAMSHSTDPTIAMRWDAHSQAEFAVLKAVANGVKTAGDIYTGLKAQLIKTGSNEIPNYIQFPLFATVKAYTEAADVAELVGAANERLQIAEERSKLYPVEVLDGILEYCRAILKDNKKGFSNDLGERDLRESEQKLRERISAARELLLNPQGTDPTILERLIADLQEDVGDLQDQASLMNTLDAIAGEWRFFNENRTLVGGLITSKNEKYETAGKVLSDWYFRFYPVYFKLKLQDSGRRAEGRAELAALSKDSSRVQEALQTFALLATTQEERERWITLGLRIGAMIGIGLITSGIGTFAFEGLTMGAGWGLTTGGVVGAVVISSSIEAGVFTGLSTSILGSGPNQSLLSTFLENWALFGALKGISIGLEATLGAKYSAFAAKGGGNVTTLLALQIGYSLERAKMAQGGNLSTEQANSIVTENLIVFIATAILGRYAGGKFFEGIGARGEKFFKGSFLEVDNARLEAFHAARDLGRMSGVEQVKRALSLDTEALKKEIDLLKSMEEFARSEPGKAKLAGIDPDNLNVITDLMGQNLAHIEAQARTGLAMDLTSEGGALFSCKPGELNSKIDGYLKLGDTVEEHPANDGEGRKITVTNKKNGQKMTIREQQEGEIAPFNSDRYKLSILYESLTSDAARDEFEKILMQPDQRSTGPDPRRALQRIESLAKSRNGLEAELTEGALRREANQVLPEERVMYAEQMLDEHKFVERPDVQEDIAAKNLVALRGKIGELLAWLLNLLKFPASEGYKVLADVRVWQEVGAWKKANPEWVEANPGKDPAGMFERDGKRWVDAGQIDVLVLQQNSSGTSTPVRAEEVKTGTGDAPAAARRQIGQAMDFFAKVARGDTSFRVFHGDTELTDEIDYSSSGPTIKVRGLKGKELSRKGQPGFDLSIGLTEEELTKLVKHLFDIVTH